MTRGYLVDGFADAQYLEMFTARRSAIVQTIGTLGLQGVNESESPALIFGGSGFALQGIDTFMPAGLKIFDVDAIANRAIFGRIEREVGFSSGPFRLPAGGYQGRVRARSPYRPMSVDLLTGNNPNDFTTTIGRRPYTGSSNSSALLHESGVLVVEAGILASARVHNPLAQTRHLAALVKGHVVATHKEHPIVENGVWKNAIGGAIDRLIARDVVVPEWRKTARLGPAYPFWLRQLIRRDFAHPAFETIGEE